MNMLEDAMLVGAEEAQKTYERMTEGHWLGHAPELFLQSEVARAIFGAGFSVYVDASVSKTKLDMKKAPGRPTKDKKKRFDISVWNKSDNTLRAVVEIKRTYFIGALKSDAKKIVNYLRQKGSAKTGYLLVYTDCDGKKDIDSRQKLNERLEQWAELLKASLNAVTFGTDLQSTYSSTPPRLDSDAWAVGLIRFYK